MLTLIMPARVLFLLYRVQVPLITAGDQLAIWNQVNVRGNEPIPSTHLTIFVPPALGAFILANLKSPKGDPPQSLLNPIHPLSSPHLDLFTSISLLFFLNMKTSSWTMLDRLLRQVSSDPNLSPFLLLPMKVSTMENLVGRYAFQCHRQTLLALLADSPPQSHSNKAPIVPRHQTALFDLQLPFPIPMTPLMFSSTPLFCVSLISLYSALRVLTLMKLRHLRTCGTRLAKQSCTSSHPFPSPCIYSSSPRAC